jgi:hypothetical protein
MANLGQQLQTPPIPKLASSGDLYSSALQNQNNSFLNIFFVKLVNAINSAFGIRGGKFINSPYGAFQDSTDQTAANTTIAYAVKFNTTDFSNGVTLSNDSRLNVSETGIWNLQFSIQFTNNTNSSQDVDIWFRKNGTNIDNSNNRFGFSPRKAVGDPFHIIAAMNFFVSLNAGDYIEIMWRTSDTGVSIEQYGTSTSPTRPSIPSAIVTMSFVSNLSV